MAIILLVDDEESIVEFVSYNLRKYGHEVEVARSGGEAHAAMARQSFELVILDIMLPDVDGFDVLKDLRAKGNTPVLMLSALDDATDKILGLELGADDYLTKPFDVRELTSRIKAILRRSSGEPRNRVLTVHEIRIDRDRRVCSVNGQEVDLTTMEFDLLQCLIINAGLVLSRQTLIEKVWKHAPSGERTVDSHVKSLRKKLGRAGARESIETIRGIGYRLRERI
ncbi:MAG: response regulator transcription factor [Actinobacteria bacterium]|nr:response regulator transcription factor [Actinomycetota bacterium]MCG2817584.1 response regulator transcription factor [Actinomycetes bacterium]MBU4219788.1 response regulator transcription factor [Actinomycetota bacterium]MBU4359844.1 response regulator transcription factor [Actinomycetota bacterium]MBU4391256.1 response regulator transcription factor [Actinomycetota bacterium]